MMHKKYQNVFDKIAVSEELEYKLLDIPEKSSHRKRNLRRPSKMLFATAVTLAILISGVFTVNAASDGIITEWIEGIAYHNDSKEYCEEFSSYDVYQVKSTETDVTGEFEWKQKNGEWYVYLNGKPAEGYYLIDGYWYWFTGGYMWHDCDIPPGKFDSEGHWIYEGPKNSDYDVSPAPVFLCPDVEDYCRKEISCIRIKKYTPADPDEYTQDLENGCTEGKYVNVQYHGDDLSNIGVESIHRVFMVETDDEAHIAEICDYLLNVERRDYMMEPLPECYRIVFIYADGTRDYLSVRENDGDCCICTRAGTNYYADIQVIEDLFNELS